VTITSILGSLKRPWSLAFDAKGDLWVASYGDSTIVGFSPAQLATSGSPVPYAAISGSQGTTNCIGIAFDAQGNLWVATFADTVAKFTPDALTSIGTPTPAVILKMPSGTISIAIAFDNSGSLWVTSYVGNKLLKFTSSQLTTTGSPTPTTIISNTGGSLQVPQGLAFSPPAQDLAIP
jgi:streptogramin lyase